MDDSGTTPAIRGSAREVFGQFLRLGLTSFGGPVAHIGYFRAAFVTRLGWLDEASFADLVALCQFLPGPASSQVGFAIGLIRAGYMGALAAFAGFTLPSAVALTLFAYGASVAEGPLAAGALHGLRLVAVAVVAQAVWGMARTLTPDRTRATIALGAALLVLWGGGGVAQIAAIAAGALAGLALCQGAPETSAPHLPVPVSRRASVAALAVFAAGLAGLPLLAGLPGVVLFTAFYRSGALVFGGGHVVLPLLHEAVVRPGWVGEQAFLSGYGAAQAVPGPLFTFAAYLGALAARPGGIVGAAIALAGIFLPGFLLIIGVLPFWAALRRQPSAAAAMRGTNAAVVGVLGAALYTPIFTGSVRTPFDFGLALAGFVALTAWRAPPLLVVVLGALGGVALGWLGDS